MRLVILEPSCSMESTSDKALRPSLNLAVARLLQPMRGQMNFAKNDFGEMVRGCRCIEGIILLDPVIYMFVPITETLVIGSRCLYLQKM